MNQTIKHLSHEHGNAIVTIMVAMMLIMLIASALINHYSVAESNAVSESLAKSRVFWAMRGHVDYALSRARNTGNLIANLLDAGKKNALGNYLNELGTVKFKIDDNGTSQNIITTPASGLFRWHYPDGNVTQYLFDITKTVGDETQYNTTSETDDGRLFMSFGLNPLNDNDTVPVLRGLDRRVPDLRVDFCLGFTRPTDVGMSCEGNDTGNLTGGHSWIERMTLVR